MLGVSFIAGTLVLTATIQKTFDDLFADINRSTDAAVRAPEGAVSSDFGGDRRPNIPASPPRRRAHDADGRRRPAATSSLYAQIVGKRRQSRRNPGNGPPTFGFGWDTEIRS